MIYNAIIAKSLNIQERQVANTLKLLSEGSTIPFISRYRKEMTGELNEVQIQEIQEKSEKFTELEKRKDSILKSIEEQGKLTDELKKRIKESWNINEIEDMLSWLTGRKVFDEKIYYFHSIPTHVSTMMVVMVALGAISIAVLASVLPARRASRLHPVRALRYE